MPELAEVEFFRKQWNPGCGARVREIILHPRARNFQGIETEALQRKLSGAWLRSSQAHGKQMVFQFSRHLWLGLHLGMTGSLTVEPRGYQTARHDHLVLRQARHTLVFRDPRQFGRVLFHEGPPPPPGGATSPPPVLSDHFTPARVEAFLQRHGRLAIKAALLCQEGFPGVGNWMADEILWRTRLHPSALAGSIEDTTLRNLWRQTRWVSQRAMATIGLDGSDPPRGWLFHERWGRDGRCPRHKRELERSTIGGRTTAWCQTCQPRQGTGP